MQASEGLRLDLSGYKYHEHKIIRQINELCKRLLNGCRRVHEVGVEVVPIKQTHKSGEGADMDESDVDEGTVENNSKSSIKHNNAGDFDVEKNEIGLAEVIEELEREDIPRPPAVITISVLKVTSKQ